MHETTATPSGLAITANGSTRYATVVACGNLDRGTAPQLEACLGRLRPLGCSRLVLDLGAVACVDAAGLAVLLHAAKGARRHGEEVILRRGNRRLLLLLEITQLALAFSIEPSVDQVA